MKTLGNKHWGAFRDLDRTGMGGPVNQSRMILVPGMDWSLIFFQRIFSPATWGLAFNDSARGKANHTNTHKVFAHIVSTGTSSVKASVLPRPMPWKG